MEFSKIIGQKLTTFIAKTPEWKTYSGTNRINCNDVQSKYPTFVSYALQAPARQLVQSGFSVCQHYLSPTTIINSFTISEEDVLYYII